jgi:hypothetical protein
MTLAEFGAMFDGFALSRGAKSETATAEDHAEYDAAYALFHARGQT